METASTTTEITIDLRQSPEKAYFLTPRRIEILLALCKGFSTVRALANHLHITERAVQDHLKVLEQLGAIKNDRGKPRAYAKYNARRLELTCRRIQLTLDLS